MEQEHIWLLVTIFLPLVGAALLFLLEPRGYTAVRQSALITSLTVLVLTGFMVTRYWFVGQQSGEYAISEFEWLGTAASIHFAFGLDGLSLWLFGLSALLTVTAVVVSWEVITERPAMFYGLLLVLESGMLGVFAARDLILFYMFFEFTLIPLFFLIGIWGHEERRYAAAKFFLFTFAGSVLALLGLLAIVLWVHSASGLLTFSIPELTDLLTEHPIPNDAAHNYLQSWIFVALALGFSIKVPLVPLHTWLPLAHVQAPTGGSVDLAGILLKLGTYGFLRFCLPMLPEASAIFAPYILWLAVIGIVYGALVALAQSDMKRLIAYSSVSHMGFVMLGFFALNRLGMQGGILQMISHGLSTGGLFTLVGMIYERYHTREIGQLGGLAKRTPRLATMFVLFTMSSIGLPGLNGFVGEFMLLCGMFQRAWSESPDGLHTQYMVIAALAVSGVVLGAWYMLWLVQRVFFGPLREAHLSPAEAEAVPDLSAREMLALGPLLVFIVWIGIYPRLFLEPIAPAADRLVEIVEPKFNQHYNPPFNVGWAVPTEHQRLPSIKTPVEN